MIRVVIADDHPIVREGMSALEGFVVVGVASTRREAVREVVTTRPDVAVLDLQMPDLDGIAATKEITRVAPAVAVLVLTMFSDDDSVFAAMRAGARGYLVKGAEQDEIARAIRAVAAGEAIAAGLANGAITARLGVAVKTVASNVSAIFAKLQVADRAAAIIRARDAGLGRCQ